MMKLAEALRIRADLQRKISQLKECLKDGPKVREGDAPAADANDLYAQLDDCLLLFEELVTRIRETSRQTVHNGQTLSQMMARKEGLSIRVSLMRDVLSHVAGSEGCGGDGMEAGRRVNVPEWRRETDHYSRQLRELDMDIQRLNGSVELV